MENSGYKIYRYSQNIMANGEKIRGIVWQALRESRFYLYHKWFVGRIQLLASPIST
jgi:hypothetical protein